MNWGSGEPPAQGAQRTDPRGFVLKAIEGLRSAILPLAAILFTQRDDELSSVMLVGAVVTGFAVLVSGVLAYISWTRLTYSVGTNDIRVESGLMSRKVRSVPFERIQDVATTQGFLARTFGLVELTFDTGAGAGEDIALAYLRTEEGERLRRLVRDRRGAADGPDIDLASDAQSQILFAMSPGRVVLFGLFNFSLVVIGVTGGLLAQYDDFLPFDVWDIEGWQERLAGPGAWLAGLGSVAQAIGIAVLLAVLGLFGLATGVVRTVLAQWGFVLERTEKGFRRRRGLFTRTDVTLPRRRVQAATIGARGRENLLGWRGASLVSLAADAGASNHDIAPLARMEEIAPLIAEAGLRMPHEALHWHRIARMQAILTGGARVKWWWSIAGGLLLFQMFGNPPSILSAWWAPLIPFGIGLWKALRLTLSMWRTRYALDEEHLYYLTGWLSLMIQIVPRAKLQNAVISQGPLERLLSLSWLSLGVAGTVVSIPGLSPQRARSLRRQLVPDMLRADFSRLN